MNNRRNLLAAAIIVAILTFFLTQTRVIQTIVAPIYILYFVISNFLLSLPELLYWVLFILAVGQLFLTVILRNFNIWLDQRTHNQPMRQEELPGAVEKYLRWIEQEHDGSFFKWRVRQRVIQLTLATIGRNESLPLEKLDHALQNNQFALPNSVKRYMQDGLKARELDRQPRKNGLLSGAGRTKIDYTDLEATLTYLEQVLELKPLPPRSVREPSTANELPAGQAVDTREVVRKTNLKKGFFEGKDVQGKLL